MKLNRGKKTALEHSVLKKNDKPHMRPCMNFERLEELGLTLMLHC